MSEITTIGLDLAKHVFQVHELAGDAAREATSDEVKELKAEARQLKETLAEVLIEKPPAQKPPAQKSVLGNGEDGL
jgi:transposase